MTKDTRTVSTETELGSASLMPLIAKYAIPSIISMLVGALYNLTDQIFIGRIVGVVGNAASNVVFPTATTIRLSKFTKSFKIYKICYSRPKNLGYLNYTS